ncbi:hypothetical protein PR048_003368 [Dryococelus australis]|uniref:Uncharacterized protein n=1 Tax=Dryococelus australis TaxID=614101 RepID=A0ABQ9IMU1_9NEOP|nr:hypothetical protein PR048_003368 [Dryococelus australis]
MADSFPFLPQFLFPVQLAPSLMTSLSTRRASVAAEVKPLASHQAEVTRGFSRGSSVSLRLCIPAPLHRALLTLLHPRRLSRPQPIPCHSTPHSMWSYTSPVSVVTGGGGGRSAVADSFSRQGEPVSIPGWAAPGFSNVGIVPDNVTGRRVFSGVSRFPWPCILALYAPHFCHKDACCATTMIATFRKYKKSRFKPAEIEPVHPWVLSGLSDHYITPAIRLLRDGANTAGTLLSNQRLEINSPDSPVANLPQHANSQSDAKPVSRASHRVSANGRFGDIVGLVYTAVTRWPNNCVSLGNQFTFAAGTNERAGQRGTNLKLQPISRLESFVRRFRQKAPIGGI